MRFLADESLEARIVEFLRDAGHDVTFVAETAPALSDPDVLELANRERRMLVTNDKDFGELVFRSGRVSFGVILIRSQSEAVDVKISQLTNLLATHSSRLGHSFTVLTDDQIRSRPLPRFLEIEFARKRRDLNFRIGEILQSALAAMGLQIREIGAVLGSSTGPISPDTVAAQELQMYARWCHPGEVAIFRIDITIAPDPQWQAVVTITSPNTEVKHVVVEDSVDQAMPSIREHIIASLKASS